MNKKQKKTLERILIAVALVIVLKLLPPLPMPVELALYCIPYLVVGWDVLRKALKGIKNRQPFDECFLMAVATVGAFALGDYMVPSIIESAGGQIVSEILDEAIRPFHCDISLEGDVVDAYASAIYDKKLPLTIFQPAWDVRFEQLKKQIKEYNIDGVLWYQLAFDEIFDMEFTVLRKRLSDMGMPVMKLESSYEYSREAMAPLTTRLESFVESIKEAK